MIKEIKETIKKSNKTSLHLSFIDINPRKNENKKPFEGIDLKMHKAKKTKVTFPHKYYND